MISRAYKRVATALGCQWKPMSTGKSHSGDDVLGYCLHRHALDTSLNNVKALLQLEAPARRMELW